ncbi:MAG: lamin tail domain-containing protein [Methermicoccaceae archaeon]
MIGVHPLMAALVIMASLSITNVSYDPSGGGVNALNQEWVEITNTGSDVELGGYVLSDAQGHRYTFGQLTLSKDSSVKVHTGEGDDNATDVFWGRKSPVWNNEGDIIRLSDEGKVLAERAYGNALPPPASSGGAYIWGVSLSTIVLVAAIFISSLLKQRGKEEEDEVDWVQFVERGAKK